MIIYTCKCNYLLNLRCDEKLCYQPALETTLVLDQLLSSNL